MQITKKFRDELTMHASEIFNASENFEIPLAEMFSVSEPPVLDEGDLDDTIESTIDAHRSAGFVTCAGMLMHRPPVDLVREFAIRD